MKMGAAQRRTHDRRCGTGVITYLKDADVRNERET